MWFAAMTKPSHAQNTYFHRDPFLNRRGDIRLSSRGASSRVAFLAVKRDGRCVSLRIGYTKVTICLDKTSFIQSIIKFHPARHDVSLAPPRWFADDGKSAGGLMLELY
jgi:chorismate synthase